MVARMIIIVALFLPSLGLSFPSCMMHPSQCVLVAVIGLLSLEPWSTLEPRIYPSPLESLYLEASGMQPAGNEAKWVLPKKMPVWKMTFLVCVCLSRESCQNVLCLATNESWVVYHCYWWLYVCGRKYTQHVTMLRENWNRGQCFRPQGTSCLGWWWEWVPIGTGWTGPNRDCLNDRGEWVGRGSKNGFIKCFYVCSI